MKTSITYLALGLAMLGIAASCTEDPGLTVTPEFPPQEVPLPAGYHPGITRISEDSLLFVLQAPHKKTVHLLGDFNQWKKSDSYRLNKSGEYFWIRIGDLEPEEQYVCQYLVDETIRVADPYARQISDPWNDKHIPDEIYPNLISYPAEHTTETAMVVSTASENYPWKVTDFDMIDVDDLVIYELLIRDFTPEGSIKAAMGKLNYLRDLGVTAVQLMPFNEFEGNDSWGYNPSFYFATDKAYGKPADYKAFIDGCHERGMAVIMDMVLNHSYGQSPMVRLYKTEDWVVTPDNPWYNVKSNFAHPDAQWGFDFNHESKYTQAFVRDVCNYWLTEYKIDGYRFDFTKGFSNTPHPVDGPDNWGSNYDAARIETLKRIYDEIKQGNPKAIMICEHLAVNEEEKELADHGIYLWGNMNYSFNEATMGWIEQGKDNLSWLTHLNRGWNDLNLVGYMESHDEERIMFKNLAYGNSMGDKDIKQLPHALERCEAAAVLMLSVPGPKMIWQFGEMGYDVELNDDRLAHKPPHWEYLEDVDRMDLVQVYTQMNKLRATSPAFSVKNYEYDFIRPVKYIHLRVPGREVVTCANFSVTARNWTYDFGVAGTWKDLFTGEVIVTNDQTSHEFRLEAGAYKVLIQQ